MARPFLTPAGWDLLQECQSWSAMLSLTRPASRRLDELVRWCVGATAPVQATRREVLVALILNASESPGAVAGVAPDLRQPKYSGLKKPVAGFGPIPRDRLVVKLPSPISWRLNRLVERGRTINPYVTRTSLTVGLIFIAEAGDKDRVRKLVRDLASSKADDCALQDEAPELVLTTRRPHPGPRPRG
jgi:hypothetical protein